jgi:hypothetical protein
MKKNTLWLAALAVTLLALSGAPAPAVQPGPGGQSVASTDGPCGCPRGWIMGPHCTCYPPGDW